jgi:dephospho-CoA kinase
MIKTGITGGIGSGKSVVCEIFRRLGVPIFNSDREARQLLEKDPAVLEAVKKNFGAGIYSSSGAPDRKRLATLVFSDEKKLHILNDILHPAVQNNFERWLSENQNVPYILKEAAIIFETGTDRHLDAVIAVSAPEELRIKRVAERDGVSPEEVKKRMAHQWSDEQRTRRAAYVIYNDEKQPVIPQVLHIHELLTQKAKI